MDKVLILVIDGCAPEYITPEYAPNIHKLARQFELTDGIVEFMNEGMLSPSFHQNFQ